MWFKKVTYLYVFVLLAGMLCQCKKYRDDVLISFKAPFKRITTHPWRVTWFGVNNQDSTNHLYASSSIFSSTESMAGSSFTFSDNPTNSYGDQQVYHLFNPLLGSASWSFQDIELIGGKNSININSGENSIKPLINSSWNILKLTDKDFHLSTTYNNKNYEIYFSAQ